MNDEAKRTINPKSPKRHRFLKSLPQMKNRIVSPHAPVIQDDVLEPRIVVKTSPPDKSQTGTDLFSNAYDTAMGNTITEYKPRLWMLLKGPAKWFLARKRYIVWITTSDAEMKRIDEKRTRFFSLKTKAASHKEKPNSRAREKYLKKLYKSVPA